ncbi:MAG: hypothetical protein GYA24_01760 [Candidatus Lokiarchaeota archaeon]|nr:hypothetical protein [Candidatus Lokiarchaeota archaeon]
MESQIVVKGTFSGGKLVVKEARGQKDDASLARLIGDASVRLPSFALDTAGKPRTILLEDIDGYTFIKLFPGVGGVEFVLIRIYGIIYGTQEIRKISMQLAQYVDVNLDLDALVANTAKLLASTSASDFTRPVRSQLGMVAWLSDDDRGKRVEELLPIMNQVRHATTIPDRILFTKLELLERHGARKGSPDDQQVISIVDNLIVALDAARKEDLSLLDKGIVEYNMAHVLRELGHLASSSKLFQSASRAFTACQAQQLAIFAAFNDALNAKQANDLASASGKIAGLRPVVQASTVLQDSFKGMFYRHDGEICQGLKDIRGARAAFTMAIACFERAKQVNFDAALCYFARGMFDFADESFFDACKNFTFSTNILGMLGQDTSKVTRNLGISYFNLAREYAVAIKVLGIERDASHAVDMAIKGIGFLFLAQYYAGTEMGEQVKGINALYSRLCEEMQDGLPANDKDIASQLYAISREYAALLVQQGIDLKTKAKDLFEKIRSFQPMRVYYTIIIFKGNGLAIYSRESKARSNVPTMDENLIAGMISGITSFLTEVLSGEQQLTLLDRDNIKIIFEHSKNLMGIVFANKETAKLRQELKDVLETTERDGKAGLEHWTGDMAKFAFIDKLAARFMD